MSSKESNPTASFSERDMEAWFEEDDKLPEQPSTITHEDISQKYTEAQLRIVRSSMDITLHSLKQSLRDSSYINIHPGYQRRHRWDIKKRSQLIESLMLNIPVPPVFLFENDYNQYEVMDGRQRLEAITGFLDNTYRLRGLEYWQELNGYNYSELPPTLQRGLLRRTVSAIVLLAETARLVDSEIDIRLALFKRLNTGGVKLNPHELRNALYQSEFNSMLARISEWDTFRDAWGIPRFTAEEKESVPKRVQGNALYKTMADLELVLRFFAIKETITGDLQGSLQKIMDRCMKRHAKDSADSVRDLEAEYRKTLAFLSTAFEGHPFVLPTTQKPSRPAYDALMVAASILGIDNIKNQPAKIRSNFSDAVADQQKYEVIVGRGNTVEAIRDRVDLAKVILGA